MKDLAAIPDNLIKQRSKSTLSKVHFRPFEMDRDIYLIHNWVSKPYAMYWGMQGFSLDETIKAHQQLIERSCYDLFIGVLANQSVCLMERYKASEDEISNHYACTPSDFGMHLLVAPRERHISGFTWHIFTSVMDFMFSKSEVYRIIVEPDVRNDKIHKLNARAGFQYQKIVRLSHKVAHLAWCSRPDYAKAREMDRQLNEA